MSTLFKVIPVYNCVDDRLTECLIWNLRYLISPRLAIKLVTNCQIATQKMHGSVYVAYYVFVEIAAVEHFDLFCAVVKSTCH